MTTHFHFVKFKICPLSSVCNRINSDEDLCSGFFALHLGSVFVYIVAVLLIGGCLDMIFLDPSVYLSPVLAVCFLSSIGGFSFSVCKQHLSSPIGSLICPAFLVS